MSRIFFILTVLFNDGTTIVLETPTLSECIETGLVIFEENTFVNRFDCETGNFATQVVHSGLEI